MVIPRTALFCVAVASLLIAVSGQACVSGNFPVPPPSWPTDLAWEAKLQFEVQVPENGVSVSGSGRYYFEPASSSTGAMARIDMDLTAMTNTTIESFIQSTTLHNIAGANNGTVDAYTWYNSRGVNNLVCAKQELPPFSDPFAGTNWCNDGLYRVGFVNMYYPVHFAGSSEPAWFWIDARTQNPANQTIINTVDGKTTKTFIYYSEFSERKSSDKWSLSYFSVPEFPSCTKASSLVHRSADTDPTPFAGPTFTRGHAKQLADKIVQSLAHAAAAGSGARAPVENTKVEIRK